MPYHAAPGVRTLRPARLTDRQYRAAAIRLLAQVETWGGLLIRVNANGAVLPVAEGGAFVETLIFVPEAEALKE